MKIYYADFSHAATNNNPYLWQCRLACGEPLAGATCDLKAPDDATRQWLSGGLVEQTESTVQEWLLNLPRLPRNPPPRRR